MKRAKKAAALLLAGLMTMAMTITAGAAGLSKGEQGLVSYAKSTAEGLGINTSGEKYLSYETQAINYLKNDGRELGSSDIEKLKGAIRDSAAAAAEFRDESGLSFSEIAKDSALFAELQQKIFQIVSPVAKEVGIKLYFSGGTIGIQEDASGEPVKQTGTDFGMTLIIAAGLVLAVGACGIVAGRKRLFAGAAA